MVLSRLSRANVLVQLIWLRVKRKEKNTGEHFHTSINSCKRMTECGMWIFYMYIGIFRKILKNQLFFYMSCQNLQLLVPIAENN